MENSIKTYPLESEIQMLGGNIVINVNSLNLFEAKIKGCMVFLTPKRQKGEKVCFMADLANRYLNENNT